MIQHTQIDHLKSAIRLWGTRDPDVADAAVRQAANDIIAGIDEMLLDLHRLRNHTIAEIRIEDDLANARVDALLQRMRDAVELPPDVMARIDAHAKDLSGFGTQ